jgi:ABC-type transport system involved in cytochrome bd biosynthesis fused ATPase/permease subunit
VVIDYLTIKIPAMNVKNFTKAIPFAVLLMVCLPAVCNNLPVDSKAAGQNTNTEETRAQQLIQRLESIRDMNKSAMTKAEKHNLRKEVKDIRKEMRSQSHLKTYIYIGAVLLAIILIILLI